MSIIIFRTAVHATRQQGGDTKVTAAPTNNIKTINGTKTHPTRKIRNIGDERKQDKILTAKSPARSKGSELIKTPDKRKYANRTLAKSTEILKKSSKNVPESGTETDRNQSRDEALQLDKVCTKMILIVLFYFISQSNGVQLSKEFEVEFYVGLHSLQII